MTLDDLEKSLKGLLRGQYSSLLISFNETNGPNYQTVAEVEAERGKGWRDRHQFDWVSEEERQRAIAANSMWGIQWYPDTPVGFCAVAASSLAALIEYIIKENKL